MICGAVLGLCVCLCARSLAAGQPPKAAPHDDAMNQAVPNGSASVVQAASTGSGSGTHSVTRRTTANPVRPNVVSRRSNDGKAWYADGLIALFAVLAMIAAVSMAVKKWGGKFRMAVGGGSEGLELVSRLALSPKQSVCLIRLGRQLVLTGVTADQISSLAVVDDPEMVAELLASADANRQRKTGGGFGSLFTGFSSGYRAAFNEPERPAEVPMMADDGQYRRARMELSGLLDRFRSRGYPVEPETDGTDTASERGTIAVA